MTRIELLESVKARFHPLLVREDKTLEAFLSKALGMYQDRAGVMQVKRLERDGGTCVDLPDDYLGLVHVQDSNGMLVYADEVGGFVELEPSKADKWPFRMTYLMNLRDVPDDKPLPPAIIGLLSDYLEALINMRNVARQRRASIDGKYDYSDLPDEPTLYQRVQELEEKMSANRAIIPGSTSMSGVSGKAAGTDDTKNEWGWFNGNV